jgi:hypothetical protein
MNTVYDSFPSVAEVKMCGAIAPRLLTSSWVMFEHKDNCTYILIYINVHDLKCNLVYWSVWKLKKDFAFLTLLKPGNMQAAHTDIRMWRMSGSSCRMQGQAARNTDVTCRKNT